MNTHPITAIASGATGRRPQRWAVVAAWLAFLCVLPSIAWRVAMLSGLDLGFSEAAFFQDTTGTIGYVLALDAGQLTAGALCLGLVAPWGERLPGWMPRLGGRRIPRLVPAALGLAGASLVALVVLYLGSRFVPSWLGVTDDWTPADGMSGGQTAVLVAAYAPLLIWAPAIVVAVVGYWRRRSPASPPETRDTPAR